jgi:hypothetical protein
LNIQHVQQQGDWDCMRACVAMVLGRHLEAVPDLYRGDGSSWERMSEWLLGEGFCLARIPMRPPTVQQAISRLKGHISGSVILGACCTEEDPSGHCIVVTPERVHDPAYDRPGVHCLGATHTNGEVWVMVISALPSPPEQPS